MGKTVQELEKELAASNAEKDRLFQKTQDQDAIISATQELVRAADSPSPGPSPETERPSAGAGKAAPSTGPDGVQVFTKEDFQKAVKEEVHATLSKAEQLRAEQQKYREDFYGSNKDLIGYEDIVAAAIFKVGNTAKTLAEQTKLVADEARKMVSKFTGKPLPHAEGGAVNTGTAPTSSSDDATDNPMDAFADRINKREKGKSAL